MEDLPELMAEYCLQMEKGLVSRAYRGLMDYILGLRAHLKNRYPASSVSGSIYPGYMDMTYFSFSPASIQRRSLKIAIVFLHAGCRFEVWLAGANRQVQADYWKLFQASGWDRYRLAPLGGDAVLEHVLSERPDFRDLDALTAHIERETLDFTRNVDAFLAANGR